ncbi:MAG: molybdopterin biosynthesis protein MoeB, partial [Thermomicrobiales bacterium]|nr:molybdopterin biosynthesis protein MoeB [Thermomicrobiales bacterium]
MSAIYRDLFERTRSAVREVDAAQAQALIAEGAQVLDVREADEVEQGIIPGAIHIPRGF